MTSPRRRGSSVGPYRLEAPLGRGGMGEVWRATGPAGSVALKILLLSDGAAGARFLREARLGAQLDHPNLVRVLDVGEQGGLTYLAMELVDGTTLSNLLWRGGRLAPNLLLDLGRQMAAGVDALHAADLIHRDLKPGNVMVTRKGKVKIADLGLVGGAALDTLTRTGTVVGTPRFMAPEQIREGYSSPRSDLFAVAMMLYLALTGRDPYDRAPDMPLGEALQRLVTEDPKPWYPERAGGPLDRVFQAALARDPEARPASGKALMEAMTAAIEKERSGTAQAVEDPSTELLTMDPTDTLELAASEAPQLPKEVPEMPAEAPAPPRREPPPGTEPAPARRIPWVALGLAGAVLGALLWPRQPRAQVIAWAILEGNAGSALVFHTDRAVALDGDALAPDTAHVVPWGTDATSPRTRSGGQLFATPPRTASEALGNGRLQYDRSGAILLSFPSPGLGSLTIESGVHRWRPTPSQDADLPELRFRLPGGEISEPLVVRLEAGGGSVPLAQLVPPPPAEALRTAALEGLARWDPRDLLAPAVTGDHVSVARRVLEHPVMADYLAIEANVIQTLETRPNFTPPGLDRVLLIDAYLTYAGQPSPIRLAHAPPRARVWRHGFWPIPIPRYDGLVVMSDGARIFSYDHAGEASSTHDPTGLIGGNFGTRPLRAPELPPGPCWLEVYSNLWREMTYAAVWVNDHGPFFLAERHRADPAQDLAEYIQRTPGPFPEPNPDHQLLRVRLPGGVVRPEDPLSHPDGGANTLRIELRSWATPTDIMNPWAFLHGYGVRPLDAVPLPPGASDG